MSDTGPLVDKTLEELERCLREHDRASAVRAILASVDDGLAIEDLYTLVLSPFLASLGRSWQQGGTAVWEEHLIVGAVRAAIEALYPRVLERKAARTPVPMTVAFFCPPEETHDVGLRMLADRFDLRGFRTLYVGAGTPVEEMVKCVRSESVDVVCLSASTHFQKTSLRNVISTLREQLPGVRIIAGGPAFAVGRAGWEDSTTGSVETLLDELLESAGGPVSAANQPTPRAETPGGGGDA